MCTMVWEKEEPKDVGVIYPLWKGLWSIFIFNIELILWAQYNSKYCGGTDKQARSMASITTYVLTIPKSLAPAQISLLSSTHIDLFLLKLSTQTANMYLHVTRSKRIFTSTHFPNLLLLLCTLLKLMAPLFTQVTQARYLGTILEALLTLHISINTKVINSTY